MSEIETDREFRIRVMRDAEIKLAKSDRFKTHILRKLNKTEDINSFIQPKKSMCALCGFDDLIVLWIKSSNGNWNYEFWENFNQKHKCWISY